jgi:hypothetical protein
VASTYLDVLAKFQEQGLDTLKKAQDASIESLTSVREMVEKLPAPPSIPSLEELPTVPQIIELNSRFLERIVQQQKAYGQQLATIFAPIKKSDV